MKLIAIFLFAACLHVSASGYSQKISLSQNNVSLKKVFKEIENQTGYHFFYKDKVMRQAGNVSINAAGASVEEVLNRCFKNQPLSYAMIDKIIVVKAKPAIPKAIPAIDLLPVAPLSIITGIVKDENGNPLTGVSVIIKGTNKGTSTNTEGSFTIEANKGDVMQFTMVGYQKKDIVVENDNNLSVVMEIEVAVGNEVVVVGYGTQKKANLTGAVEAVDTKMISSRPQENVGAILQGVSPGLNININNSGGEPGATMNFNIRGMGTPYILVDGMPMDINQVNPADIESVSVLKDASSAAIYGANAPYGVILITTKKGGSKNGKPNFIYSGNSEWSTPTLLPNPANSLEFATEYNDASINAGSSAIFSDNVIERIKYFMTHAGTDGTIPDPSDPGKWAKHENANANTNWYDVLIKKWAFRQKHNISMSGGQDDGTTYYVSGGFYDQGGQMRYGNERYQRFNLDAKVNTKITKWFQMNFLTNYSRGKSDYPDDGYGLQRAVMWHDLTRRWPTDPVTYPNGQYSEMSRINVYEHGGRDIHINNDLWLKLGGVLEPVKNWLIKGDYSWKNGNSTDAAHHALVYAEGPTGDTYTAFDTETPNSIAETFNVENYSSFNISTSYEKQIINHHFKLLLGYQRELDNFRGLYGKRNSLITDNVPSINTATGNVAVTDNIYHWSTVGTFFRLNYDFKDKYLIEVNGRRSGTSRFSEGNRYGFFPSVSAGYRISDEPFWNPIKPYINELKIRSSYGSLGNQNVANYLYTPIMPINTQVSWILGDELPIGVGAPGITSSNLTWETVRTFDLGLDASFFKHRMGVTFDYFTRDVLNMLGTASPLPALIGTALPLENNASERNTGWEGSITWKGKFSTDFQYNLKASISDYTIRITKWNNPDKTLLSNYEGQTLGAIWGLVSNGLFQTQNEIDKHADQSLFFKNWYPGDVKYEDLNGDGVINYGTQTLSDHGDLKIIGNSLPRYSYSFFFGMSWKKVDFSMFWMGVGKRDVWFSNNVFWGQIGDVWQNSLFKEHMNYWSEDNKNGYYPRPYFSGEGGKDRQISTRYLQNAAYLRLKSLQLGYSMPEELTSKVSVKNARIYLTGENLITFSKIIGIFDPEGIVGTYGQGKIYPLSKVLSIGLNITF